MYFRDAKEKNWVLLKNSLKSNAAKKKKKNGLPRRATR